jgi:hypothetical protein
MFPNFRCAADGAAEIELSQTVQDMLDWWRRLSRPGSAPVTLQSGAEARCAWFLFVRRVSADDINYSS